MRVKFVMNDKTVIRSVYEVAVRFSLKKILTLHGKNQDKTGKNDGKMCSVGKFIENGTYKFQNNLFNYKATFQKGCVVKLLQNIK